MPPTLRDGPQVRSRQAATVEIRAVAVGTRSRTRTDVDRLPGRAGEADPADPFIDIVEEWGLQSFPASDPPTNW
jgi:hypothetical protein